MVLLNAFLLQSAHALPFPLGKQILLSEEHSQQIIPLLLEQGAQHLMKDSSRCGDANSRLVRTSTKFAQYRKELLRSNTRCWCKALFVHHASRVRKDKQSVNSRSCLESRDNTSGITRKTDCKMDSSSSSSGSSRLQGESLQ